MILLRFRLALIVFVLGGLLSGCIAAHNVNRTQAHLQRVHDFRAVDADSANVLLKTYRRKGEDEVLYRLEQGMLSHYQEDWQASAKHFRRADRAIERHYTKDVTKNLQSLLINDLQLPYTGESYESIYLSTFNCLNYLQMGDTEGALVEMRRVTHKLELLNDRQRGLAQSLAKRDTADAALKKVDEKLEGVDLLTETGAAPPEIRQNSAFGRFLTTVLYSKAGQPDDARIELQKLRTALDDQGQADYLTALTRAAEASSSSGEPAATDEAGWMTAGFLPVGGDLRKDFWGIGAPSSPSPSERAGMGGMSVSAPDRLTRPTAYNTVLLSFTGTAPQKRERSFSIPIVLDEETVQLHFAVPVLDTPKSRVARVRAVAAGDTVQVPMIEDMQAVAREMFDQKKPILYTRAVIRAVLKAGVTEGAEKLAREEGSDAAGFLVEQAGNLMSMGAAQADTRGWQTMPGRVHAVPATLPEGTHEVTFEYLSDQDRVLKRRTRSVTVSGARDLAVTESIYLK